MCVPTDLRRKIILKLIEALKDSQSFQNIDISQIKEAVLKSEHQTFEQSKNKDEYLYYINEKMKKIQQNSNQRIDKINKFEFTGENKDTGFDNEDKNKIINGNIPSHVKISQMYSQEQIPQHYNNPSRKVESFAASFEQAKRNLDSNSNYNGYLDPNLTKNPYLTQDHGNFSNFPHWDQSVPMNYEKRSPIYCQNNQQFNPIMNGHMKHPTTINQSPNLHYSNRMYQPYPPTTYPTRGPLPNEKTNILDKEPYNACYANPYVRKSPVQYQERVAPDHSPHNHHDPRIQNSRANIKKANYQDYTRQTGGFTGFSPFVYRQPYSANMRVADTKMSAFMNKSEASDYNTDQFMIRGNSPRVDVPDTSVHMEAERYKMNPVNSQNMDHFSKPKDISNHSFEPINRSFQANYSKSSPHINGLETTVSNKNINLGKNTQSFEFGYSSNKGSSTNKSFVGNVNPNLYDPMKNPSQKEASGFIFCQRPEQSVATQQNAKQINRNLMFDEKKSEELFKSISQGFGFVGKRSKPDQANGSNIRDNTPDDKILSETNQKAEFIAQNSDVGLSNSCPSTFGFNEQFAAQKTPQLSNSHDSFIDPANLFPLKPENEFSNSDEFKISEELSTFLEANSLTLKEIKDKEGWKSEFKKLYRKYEEVKDTQIVPFASIIEIQNKFINFCFIDQSDINRYLKILDSPKQEITREDYLIFIEKAMEAFSGKKEGDKTIVKEIHDNVTQ